MIQKTSLFLFLLAASFILAGCSIDEPPQDTEANLIDKGNSSSLGYLEHRGHRYDVRQLMDADIRKASNDDFIQKFNPDAVLADRRVDLTVTIR